MPQSHPATFGQNSEDFAESASFSSNEMSLDQNQWNQVFEYNIEKGEGILLGRGTTNNPQQAEGHLAMRFMDNTATTAVQITGRWRFTIRASGSGRLIDVLREGDLAEYDSRDDSDNLLENQDRKPFPVTDSAFETHEYDVWLELQPDADDTIDTSPDSGNTELFADGSTLQRTR